MKQLILALFMMVASTTTFADEPQRLIVSAGMHDRADTVVSFKLLPEMATSKWQLRDGDNIIPIQLHADHGWFVLQDLAAGQIHAYRLERATEPAGDNVAVAAQGGVVHVSIDGKPVFDYQGEKTVLPAGYAKELQRGGYIHPMLTPSGIQVDDDYPSNHRHHHGIWSVWTKTEFEGRHPDFWNMGDKTGTSEPRGFKDVVSGPVLGAFHAENQMIDLSAKPAKPVLNEQWDVQAYCVGGVAKGAALRQAQGGAKPYFLYDITIHQQCVSASSLLLPDYRYGGLGFRGAGDWNAPGKYTFLTSEGKDVINGNGSRARWCFTGGSVAGKPAGVTILCGPDSFRAPQPVRLNPTEPFLCYAPPAMGEFSITPEKPYYARYRVLVADGPADKDLIKRIWNDFADPPTVTIE